MSFTSKIFASPGILDETKTRSESIALTIFNPDTVWGTVGISCGGGTGSWGGGGTGSWGGGGGSPPGAAAVGGERWGEGETKDGQFVL